MKGGLLQLFVRPVIPGAGFMSWVAVMQML